MTDGALLVVEDDDDIREIMRDILAADGFEVEVARDGLEALDKLRDGCHASLILLDMMMPRMDGEAFLTALRRDRDRADTRVVVISGNAQARARAGQLAVDGCLVKPFDLADLLEVVHRLAPHPAPASAPP
jgi:CheY-like chemotaxis protein